MEITEQQALGLFFTHMQDHGPVISVSSLVAILRDSRKFTNRNLDTGEIIREEPDLVGSWLGNLGYLILLDIIGTAISQKNTTLKNGGSSIVKALKEFSDLSEGERNALYSMRNSFAHNFSLINIGTKPKYFFRFSFKANSKDPMIVLPKKMWDGNIKTSENEMVTYINLWALGDFVEDVFIKVLAEYEKGNIKISLKGGGKELLTRYIYFIKKF